MLQLPTQVEVRGHSLRGRSPTICRGKLITILFSLLAVAARLSSAFVPSCESDRAFCRLERLPGSGSAHTTKHSAIGLVSATNSYLDSLGTAIREYSANDFWGRPRAEEDIIDYVAQAVFEDDRGKPFVTVLQAEPPLVVIRGFLEDALCEEIIQSAIYSGELTRSRIGTELTASDIRTSSTVWLKEHQCEIAGRTFAHRASRLSGLPPGNQENLQVVHYGPEQKFDVHTDHLNEFNDQNMARLATCLLYLNTAEPDASVGLSGGETWFPEIDAKITPERGTVVFWWNTLERPGSDSYDSEMYLNVDVRSRHAGLPVLSGEKWVANRWIHPIDIDTGVRGY